MNRQPSTPDQPRREPEPARSGAYGTEFAKALHSVRHRHNGELRECFRDRTEPDA